MKQTYKTPAILIVKLAAERALLEGSLQKFDTQPQVTGTNGGWAKEDASSTSGYNVWDDDWSK